MIPTRELKEVSLFRGLNTRQLQIFASYFTEEMFHSGEVIFIQGKPADKLYILQEGEVTLGIKAKGEIDITAYSVGQKGEVFGLPALIRPYRNNVSATCVKKAKAFSIEGKVFRKLLRRNSRVGLEIMERVAEIYFNRLNSTRAMITNLFKMFKFQTGKSKMMETYYET